ncbi:MAG: hypothetical protein ACE5GF_02105 [Thermodesulfobacteriota bacterium]
MNHTEGQKLKLVTSIVEGLKQKPAYLLLFGILVLFMFIVSGFAAVSWRDHQDTVVIGSFVVILVALLLAAYVIKVVEVSGRIPKDQREVMQQLLALGTKEDIPLSKATAMRWAKRWNCRWTYMSESGRLLPYVDDNVTIAPDRIDLETGLIRCRGESPYRDGTTYDLFGRISKRNMALMFYRGHEDLEALMGVIILRMKAGGSVHGWWLGIGKENCDVGGQFTWTEARGDPDFHAHEYDLTNDPPRR